MNAPTAHAQPPSEDDEISLYELWRTLINNWRWIAGGAAVGVAIAIGYLAVTPPQYEAVALVQIGQIGQLGQLGQIGQVALAPIETPARAIERVAFPTFKNTMVRKLGWNDDARGAIYASSLKVNITKGTDLLEFRVRGLTREDAATSLNMTIDHLALLHKAVAQPAVESLQSVLKEISEEIAETRKVLVELERAAMMQRQLAPRDRFSESMLYAQLMANKENRIRELRRREGQYREWISMTGKAATATFAEPSVPVDPVSPKKALTILIAMLGGSLFGVVAVMIRRGAWFNQRAVRNKTGDG